MKTYPSPAVVSLQLIFEAFLTLEIELRVITIDIFVIFEFVKFPFKALTMIKEQEIVRMLESSQFQVYFKKGNSRATIEKSRKNCSGEIQP